MKWTGALAAVLLIVACILPWVIIPSGNIEISGIDTEGTNFGKPAYFHFICISFFLFFTFTKKIWAKRANLLVAPFNLAWAVRNFFIVGLCRAGECPEKKIGLYLIVLASVLMLVSALFPDMKTKKGGVGTSS